MNKIRLRALLFLFVLSPFTLSSLALGNSPEWTWIGERFALSRSNTSHALYDLSFPNQRLKIRLMRSPSIATAQKRLEEAALEMKSLAPALSHEGEAAVIPSDFPVLETSAWWEETPWTEEFKSKNLELFSNGRSPHKEPNLFTFADIDWTQWNAQQPELQKNFQKLTQKLEEELETDRILSRIQLKKGADGDFEISLDLRGSPPVLKPTLIADIKNPKSVLKKTLIFMALSQVQGRLLNLIPVPFLGSILSGVISKIVWYRKELYINHSEMIGEFLHIAQDCKEGLQIEGCDHPRLNPLLSLTEIERSNAIRSIAFQRMSITSALLKIVRPTLKSWHKARNATQKNGERALEYLTSHTQPQLLDSMPRFALSKEGYWLLGHNKKLRRRAYEPYRSIRFEDPDRLAQMRMRAEVASWSLDFATRFVPIAGGWIRSLMYMIMNRSIYTPQHWESRLMARLEILGTSLTPNWTDHYSILERQHFNPFEISRTTALSLVQVRKQILVNH